MTGTPTPASERRNLRVAAACLGLVLSMVGAAYAAVPLYDLFCRMTGFGGTPIVGTTAPGQVLDRTVTVRFDANVAPGLPWVFQPETNQVEVKIGETATVLYRVRNTGPTDSTGVATFNVQPALTGAYFVKLQCFCFQEQTLKAGETMESAVMFYVDPAMVSDPSTADVRTITLSYTYFPAKSPKPVASADARAGAGARRD